MILNEISRIKSIMGLKPYKTFMSENKEKENNLSLLLEVVTGGKDDLYRMITKATGLSDDVAETFSKEASTFMKQSDEFAQVLSREGLDDVGKIQQKLSNAGYDVTDLNNALRIYLKQNPDISKQILKSIPEFTDNIVKNMSLESLFAKRPDLIDPLKTVSSPNFKLRTQDMVDDYKVLMGDISKLLGESGGNQSLAKILDLMEIKVKTTELSNNLNSSVVSKQSTPIKTNNNDGTDPQAYLKGLSEEQLISKLNDSGKITSRGWYDFGAGYVAEEMSGWKFHVFGETLEDSVFLIEKLKPIAEKYRAMAKVGGPTQVKSENMKPGTNQHGKQGVTMYIPNSVINSGRQQEMLSDIQNAITGYKKGGTISGDQAITPTIHYRYELSGPIPKTGIDYETYSVMYNTNSGGPYKPDDVEDLFTKKLGVDQGSNTVKPQNVSSNRLTSIIGDTNKIDWSKVANAKNVDDYSRLIDDAINTNNYSKISRGGFEEYGIPNFRKYLMDLDLKDGDVSSDMLQGNSIYQMNRDIFDLYQEEGGASPAFYDWLKTLPKDEMEDLYKYINEKKSLGLLGNQSKEVNVRPKEGPSNWSDYQDQNRGNNPYYGSGSN